ncbi:MAG: hypothetical protein HY063_13975 [Bacteroidetes bacterium]|nr:hypothetical protein [Bacteroidota bacterium]
MRALKFIFLLLNVAGLVWAAYNARWECCLQIENKTISCIVYDCPLWQPPPKPAYKEFQSSDEPLPDNPKNIEISRDIQYDSVALFYLIALWISSALIGIVYRIIRMERRDRLLHIISWIGLGGTIGTIATIVLWLIFGGWGPPVFFGILGLSAGLVIGFATSFKTPAK